MARKKKSKSNNTATEAVNTEISTEALSTETLVPSNLDATQLSIGDVFVDVDEHTLVLSNLDVTQDLTLDVSDATLSLRDQPDDQRLDLNVDDLSLDDLSLDIVDFDENEVDLSGLNFDLGATPADDDSLVNVTLDLDTAPEPVATPKVPEPPKEPKERVLAKPARAGFWNPNRLKGR